MRQPKSMLKATLRFIYKSAPLPLRFKRTIWRQVMFFKACLNNGLEANLSINEVNQNVYTLNELIKTLAFSQAINEPRISIVIPCYEKLEFTVRCLISIAKHPPNVDYEVIVVDDNSKQDDYSCLNQVPGLRLIRNQVNQGFIDSCNAAAQAARGAYLYLLNNDTVLQPNSINFLENTFSKFPEAGIVGSKLLYPNGQLQEAGGLIWSDGSAWNYGRMQSARHPSFNYLRSVDYCSGASLMIPRKLFLELGGFDTYFKPAYYEDTDLAMKVRQCGLDVLYQPLSKIVHFEGISHGKDENRGLKKHQSLNQIKFLKRWSSVLRNHRSSGQDPDLEKDRGFMRRVLLIDKCTPTPNRDAGSVCLLNFMLLLRYMGYQPTFIPDDNYYNLPPYTEFCQGLGIECLYAPYETSVKGHLRKFGSRYDLVVLFRPDIAFSHMQTVREYCPQARIIYYPHDLHYLRLEREAAVLGKKRRWKEAGVMQRRELNNSVQADSTVVLSLHEQELLRQQLPLCKIEYLPLILNTNYSATRRPQFGGQNLVFVGSFGHAPNADAVQWFSQEILPIVCEQWPQVVLHIVGANPPTAVTRLNGPNVKVLGHVEDLDSLLQNMQVAVVPLRFGAGMKGKVGTAMRCGLPVVSTTVGCEGMPVVDGSHILIANEAASFGDAVARLLGNQAQWEQLSQGGLDFAVSQWGAKASIKRMRAILENLGLELEEQSAKNINSLMLYPFTTEPSPIYENNAKR